MIAREATPLKPRFMPGQTLTTARYIPPLPKGSTVTLMKIKRRSDDDEPEYLEYLIVGHQGGYGRSLVELWVREYDLKMQLVV